MGSFCSAALGILSISIFQLTFAYATTDSRQNPTPEQIKQVAANLVCLCGSCNRESLATCICTAFAIPERESIGRQLSEGFSSDEIVSNYVDQFGNVVLAEPPPGNVRWISVVTPIIVLLFGGVVIRAVLVQWRGGKDTAVSNSPQTDEQHIKYKAQLRQDLNRIDKE